MATLMQPSSKLTRHCIKTLLKVKEITRKKMTPDLFWARVAMLDGIRGLIELEVLK